MAPNATNKQSPPSKINVHQFAASRAPEIESLHSVVANRLGDNFKSQRNKRRRTTAHDNQASIRRCRKRRRTGDEPQVSDKLPRRVRRRNELKRNPRSGFSTSGDGTKRLRTHVWHAKRFSMTKLWGFHLPLGLHGRGRGSRALLKWYRQGVVVHDASYHLAVQLEGPEDSLISILKTVLVSPPSDDSSMWQSVLSGVAYGTAMLHHAGQPISPVTYIWRALGKQNSGNSAQEKLADDPGVPPNLEHSKLFRQIWVWIHASAFTDGYKVLEYACKNEMSATGGSINCFSLEGQLAKLEVMGTNASQLLKRILHPVSGIPESCFESKKHRETITDDGQMSISEYEEQFPTREIRSPIIKDPRLEKEERVTDITQPALSSKSVPERCFKLKKHTETITDDSQMSISEYEERFPTRSVQSVIVKDPRLEKEDKVMDIAQSGEDEAVKDGIITPREILDETAGLPSSSEIDSDCNDLWDAKNGIKPPVEDNVICKERHDKRMDFFCLGDRNSNSSDAEKTLSCSRSCPVMLLRNNSPEDQFVGWSLILPLSWVKAFWVPLVSNGAHAIGLREKHWIACESGLPCFPMDFPDCGAYTSFMELEAAASNIKESKQPPSVRPMKIPVPPPWNTIHVAYDGGPSLEPTTSGAGLSCLNGSVARTSHELRLFMENLGGPVLLSPYHIDEDRSSLDALRNEANLDRYRDVMSQVKNGGKLCFLRVMLRAFKEGVFEEGAVVCAPRFADISLWTSSDNCGLQIPVSAIASYFIEETSGRWSLQAPPEDPVARESHRYPIGFVTTGFVRGSKKSAAVAFCEATWLARLREEQWRETMPVKRRKKEIFVLVRNLRSSAYRLALATIVLEQQPQDLQFV